MTTPVQFIHETGPVIASAHLHVVPQVGHTLSFTNIVDRRFVVRSVHHLLGDNSQAIGILVADAPA